MVSVHATWTVPADETDRFLVWKDEEGAIQRTFPGFLRRRLLRDRAEPTRWIYISDWETHDHLEAMAGDPGFRAASRRYRDSAPGVSAEIIRMDVVFDIRHGAANA
jgi:heme-degrading monooxygenase HmoA